MSAMSLYFQNKFISPICLSVISPITPPLHYSMVPPSTTPSNWHNCFCSCFSKSIHSAVCGGGQTHIKPWCFSALDPAITSHLTVSEAHGLALLFPELNSYPQSGPSGSHMACRFLPPRGLGSLSPALLPPVSPKAPSHLHLIHMQLLATPRQPIPCKTATLLSPDTP